MSIEGEKPSRGFQVFPQWFQNVKDTIDEVGNQARKPTEATVQGPGASQNQASNDERTVTFRKDNKASEGGSILKWIIGIGVIVALYMMFGSGTPPKQTSTPVQSTYSTNAPASNVAQPSAKQGNQELAFDSSCRKR